MHRRKTRRRQLKGANGRMTASSPAAAPQWQGKLISRGRVII
jgi:hypothetical protein